APQAAPASDNSDELLPGLSSADRQLYRRCLGDQAEVALAAGVDQVARGAYERRLAVWPEDGPASAGLARILSRVGERQAGIDQLGRALTVTPTDRGLLLLRGRLRYLQRSFGEAQADLERALQAAANDPLEARPIQVALGLVHLAAGRLKAARPLLEAADAEPGYGPARLARALLSELEGDLPTAEVHASEAIRLLQSGRAEAHYQRAYVLRKAGKLSEARDALVEALREGYGFQLANRARIDVAQAERDAAAEARLTELLVRSAPAPTPNQLAALGRVYLRQ
ncbi:MAG TPA: hypothetical protein DEA08_25770, partial [Planctomycetes bacterium]|nr:hypothetical protein [Planctomycetota bacterium]